MIRSEFMGRQTSSSGWAYSKNGSLEKTARELNMTRERVRLLLFKIHRMGKIK